MKPASAFAPGHLTGLFQICDQPLDPVYRGSRGSGVSINLGVYTRVQAEPAERTSWSVTINGRPASEAPVSEAVLRRLILRMPETARITVEHSLETPLGAGFGSSGAGALTLAMAANEVLGLRLGAVEAARVAHVAEIECRTGLGSVVAAMRGNLGVLFKPGGPGIGEGVSYERSRDYRVVYAYYAPISTREALGDPALRAKINEIGGRYVDDLHRELTPERFMQRSRSFTEHVGLATPRLRRLFQHMDSEGYIFTMAMFGEVAFAVVEKELAEDAAAELIRADPSCDPVVTGIDEEGAHLVS